MAHKRKGFALRFTTAFAGIHEAWKREQSLRIQCLAALGVVVFCIVWRPPPLWCGLFASMCALVMSLELMNSAIEAALDRVHPEQHKEIGFAKDCLAGAVMIASCASVVVFLIYLIFYFQK